MARVPNNSNNNNNNNNNNSRSDNRGEWLESRDILLDSNTEILINTQSRSATMVMDVDLEWPMSDDDDDDLLDVGGAANNNRNNNRFNMNYSPDTLVGSNIISGGGGGSTGGFAPTYVSSATSSQVSSVASSRRLSDRAVFRRADAGFDDDEGSSGLRTASSLASSGGNNGGESLYTTASFGKHSDHSRTTSTSRSMPPRSYSGISVESLNLMIDEVEESLKVSKEGSNRKSVECRRFVMAAILALVFGLGLSMGFRSSHTESNEMGRTSSGPRKTNVTIVHDTTDLLKLIVSAGITSEASVNENTESAQARAFDWLESTRTSAMHAHQLLQRYALATFYFSTDSSKWVANDKWLSDEHECEWFSRTASPCDANGTMISLSMGLNGLSGTLPPELGLLSSLHELNLMGGNNEFISGELPGTLARMSHLKSLNLMYQKFSGSLSNDLVKSLHHLEELELGFNQFEGDLPHSLGSLPNVRRAHLQDNHFGGTLPASYMTGSLTGIDLHANQIVGKVPTAKWHNLKVLRISENQFTSLSHDIDAPMLEKLRAGGNAFSGKLPAIVDSPVLELMEFNDNNFIGSIPESWETLELLTRLDVSNNLLDGPVPTSITHFDGLGELHVQGNSFSSISCPASEPKEWTADCRPVGGEMLLECPCCTMCCQNGARCRANFAS